MPHYEQLAADFYRRIDCITGAVDALAPGLEAAARQLVDAVLADKRLLLCGAGGDNALAQYAARLLRRPGDALPALPALCLGGADDPGEQLWQDLRSLSRDGDLLLCIDSSDAGATAAGAGRLAQQRNLQAVLLAPPGDHGVATVVSLQAADAELRCELALMALHELRALVLRLLMGE